MYVLAIPVSSLWNCLLKYMPILKIGSFSFLLSDCKNSLYALDANSLSDIIYK